MNATGNRSISAPMTTTPVTAAIQTPSLTLLRRYQGTARGRATRRGAPRAAWAPGVALAWASTDVVAIPVTSPPSRTRPSTVMSGTPGR
jgi:hypothetical protein